MKTKFLFFLFLLASVLVSCSDENTGGSAVNSHPTSYYPLEFDNLWCYKTPGMSLTEKLNYMVLDQTILKGNTYYVIVSTENDTLRVREDETGNIYRVDIKDSGIALDTVECMMVPAVPELDKHWSSKDNLDSLQITSMEGVVNAYTGLVEVSTFDKASGVVKAVNYYKQGVGCIRSVDYLKSTTLTLNSYYLH